jgi:hypothetical protein
MVKIRLRQGAVGQDPPEVGGQRVEPLRGAIRSDDAGETYCVEKGIGGGRAGSIAGLDRPRFPA